jgi:hypothetical protein
MYARSPATQFLPHNSASLHSLDVISMQMDAHLEKEQIGTLFVWVGAPEGGVGGGGVVRVAQHGATEGLRDVFPRHATKRHATDHATEEI